MRPGWLESAWDEPGALAWVLTPLSWIYRLAWAVSKAWHGLRPPVRVPGLKVLSVGNLSVGGTGKSSIARSLARMALAQRERTVVLLRGYGAQAGPRPLWVSRGKGPLVPVKLSGDEAQEFARVAGLGVLIDADRLCGAREAAAQGYQVLILDDGFQRRWQLQRDADLLLAAASQIQKGECLLPAGPWREPWSQAQGVKALLVQGLPRGGALPAPWSGLPLIRLEYRPQRLWIWSAGALQPGPPLRRLKGCKTLALSGLGRPQGFEASLAALGAKAQPARFNDHHPYRLGDLSGLPLTGLSAICTTAKDAMRLPLEWRPSLPVWVLEAELESQPPAQLQGLFKQLLK